MKIRISELWKFAIYIFIYAKWQGFFALVVFVNKFSAIFIEFEHKFCNPCRILFAIIFLTAKYILKLGVVISFNDDFGEYVEFNRISPHLEQGFPGNLQQKIRYTVTNNNELVINYEMCSDMTTVVNPTNHTYFNLAGHDSGDVLSQELEIFSNKFLLTDKNLIPTGEIANVEGTPMDFRNKKSIGKDINADYEPLKIAGGYDHNYIFDNDKKLKLVSKMFCPKNGIYMETYTDLCGMQVYSGNFLDGVKGKNGAIYKKNAGICFETQLYPNSCNEKKFPTSIIKPDQKFISKTIYHFDLI